MSANCLLEQNLQWHNVVCLFLKYSNCNARKCKKRHCSPNVPAPCTRPLSKTARSIPPRHGAVVVAGGRPRQPPAPVLSGISESAPRRRFAPARRLQPARGSTSPLHLVPSGSATLVANPCGCSIRWCLRVAHRQTASHCMQQQTNTHILSVMLLSDFGAVQWMGVMFFVDRCCMQRTSRGHSQAGMFLSIASRFYCGFCAGKVWRSRVCSRLVKIAIFELSLCMNCTSISRDRGGNYTTFRHLS